MELFIIDEVGPVELRLKKGFFQYLPFLYEADIFTCTVVREKLLSEFQQIFCDESFVFVPFNDFNFEALLKGN